MDFKTYQKLRSYCRGDLAVYLDTPGRQAVLSLALKLHGATGELKHELDQAKALIALTKDLTPREHDAAHLLAVISNHRAITWHREPEPPDGKEQAPPQNPEQAAALWAQTREAVEAYGVHLPERETSQLTKAIAFAQKAEIQMLPTLSFRQVPESLMPDKNNQFLTGLPNHFLDPWLAYDSWGLEMACLLITIGYPEDLRRKIAEAKDWPSDASGRDSLSAKLCVFDRAAAIARSSVNAGILGDPDTPANWLAWAERKGYDVKHLKPLATPPSTIQTGTVAATVGRAIDDDAWMLMARERAASIIKRQRAKDLYPSQENIADEIAKGFRAEGVVGREGKPITGAYIKRHALRGISSAEGKRLSTSTSRGK